MTRTPTDAFDAGLRLASALEAADVPYALGGALAYGQYGVPRRARLVEMMGADDPRVETWDRLWRTHGEE